MSRDYETVRDHIASAFPDSLREPSGPLKHRFIDPGEGYRDILWDWDAHFCATGLAPWAQETGPYVQGCVLNFVDHIREDGSIPYSLSARSGPNAPCEARRADGSPLNTIKPLLAQMTLMACDYLRDDEWVAPIYAALKRCIDHWRQTQLSALGLLTFRSHRGSGADNHPGVYGRPLNSSADVFLNAMVCREYEALATIAGTLGNQDDARAFTAARTRFITAMHQMWDPIDGMFYNLDVQRTPIEHTNQPITWAVPLKFRCWTSFTPMWAGIATQEQAQRMLANLTDPDQFWSEHGVRSMAACEPAYTNFVGSNPSNWQGPIWVVANYLVWKGLRVYGFKEEANELAARLLAMLARDIRANGCLHEYYHGGLATNWGAL